MEYCKDEQDRQEKVQDHELYGVFRIYSHEIPSSIHSKTRRTKECVWNVHEVQRIWIKNGCQEDEDELVDDQRYAYTYIFLKVK